MNLFLTDFHVFLAILAPNHRIYAIIPRFRISHLASESVIHKWDLGRYARPGLTVIKVLD